MKIKCAAYLCLLSIQAIIAKEPVPQAPIKAQDPNPSARWGTSKNGNPYLIGETIWFKPLQQIQSGSFTDNTTSPTSTTNSSFNFKFSPGYRLTLGYNLPFDKWDAYVAYTSLNYKHNNPYFIDTPTLIKHGAISMKYLFNQGDLDLGRMCLVSSKVKLRPHFGLRALWLRQTKQSYYNSLGSLISSTFKAKNNLVGLLAGLDSLWMLSKEFSLYGNASVASLVNAQKFVSTTSTDGTLLTDQFATNYSNSINACFDLALGLRWDRSFQDHKYHLGLHLGYEQHNYINIFAAPQVTTQITMEGASGAPATTSISYPTDFALQGITMGARFDF